MDARTDIDDQELGRLREEFGGWRIWRSVREGGRLGEWVASLHDPRAGVEPTLMHPTAARLREALVEQAEIAQRRR